MSQTWTAETYKTVLAFILKGVCSAKPHSGGFGRHHLRAECLNGVPQLVFRLQCRRFHKMHANGILSSFVLSLVTPGLTTFSVTRRRLIYLFQFWGDCHFFRVFFFSCFLLLFCLFFFQCFNKQRNKQRL